MISVFAGPTLTATLFCVFGWGYLTVRNAIERRLIFSVACFFSFSAYIMAVIKYIFIFYVEKSPQYETPMWLLFMQLLCHVITVLIFCYNYKFSYGRRN